MVRLRVPRGTRCKLLGALLIALVASIALINVLNTVTSLSTPNVVSVQELSFLQTFVSANQSRTQTHLLAASFVRIDPPDSPASDQMKMVLSVDVDDLVDFVDAYERGFAPKADQYPDDGGILLHNPDLCRVPTNNGRLDWVVFVHTAPENADRRQMLRETWANLALFKDLTFRVVFLVGVPPVDKPHLQVDIKNEFIKYGDIIQGNFMDSYRNMTHKAVLGLRWLSEFCPQAPYAIKADDDTFLNIFEIVPLMQKNAKKSHVIICPLWYDNAMPILRDPKTCMKWCVKRSELKGRTHFPQYCAGIGYVISRPLAPLLYNASRSTPFFWIDDVYVTGLLLKKLTTKVDYVSTLEQFTTKQDVAVENYESKEPIKYFYVHAKDKTVFMKLWKALLSRLTGDQKKMINSAIII